MQVGLIEAARLAGKNKGTLCKHRQAGKLSSTVDELGNTVYEVSELQRVYGSLPGLDCPRVEMTAKDTSMASQPEAVVSVSRDEILAVKVEALQRENDLLRQLLQATESHLATALRVLPATSETSNQPIAKLEPEVEKKPRRWLGVFPRRALA